MAYPTVERWEVEECEGPCNRGPWILRAYYSDGRAMCSASEHFGSREEAADALSTKQAARALGSLGGRAKSRAKAEAARENGKRGGRPKSKE